jgi:hypothetical protein
VRYGARRAAREALAAHVAELLRARLRRAAGREAEPSAGVIDAQSVARSAEGVAAAATSGFDPFKKVDGRKRHPASPAGRGKLAGRRGRDRDRVTLTTGAIRIESDRTRKPAGQPRDGVPA